MSYSLFRTFFSPMRKVVAAMLATMLLFSPVAVVAQDAGQDAGTETPTEETQTEAPAEDPTPQNPPIAPEETSQLEGDQTAASSTAPLSIDETISIDETTGTTTATTTEAEEKSESAGNPGDGEDGEEGVSAGGSGNASISTGDAAATADVVNVANSSFINSIGWFILLNLLFGLADDLNVSSLWSSLGGNAPSVCGQGTCAGTGSLTVANTNSAGINNDISVGAASGANTAGGGDTASIATGAAFAGANVVNVVNTNVVDSQYVLIAINNFGDWVGDLIFPSSEKLATTGGAIAEGAEVSASNNNAASIENDVASGADTGGNTAEGENTSILSGASSAVANIVNRINQNFFGGTTIYIIIRVHGDWVGDVLNAPEGISWQEDGGQIELFGELTGANGGSFGSTEVNNANTAEVRNAVKAYALTGANVASAADTASIATGDAFAAVNVVNLVNTNIFGKNWILAVINIFGNWFGNISFGSPDLWVGGRAEITPDPSHEGKAIPGTPVTLHFTVANNGDVKATAVKLRADSLKYLSAVNAPGAAHAGKFLEFNIGDILPGETREISYSGTLEWGGAYGDTLVTTEADVSSSQSDANPADNSEDVSFVSYLTPPTGGGAITYIGGAKKGANLPAFDIVKTATPTAALPGGETKYQISIENTGGEAYRSVLVDVLRSPEGKIIYRKQWDLGRIAAGEKVVIDYTTRWGLSTTPGIYLNTAQIMAMGGSDSMSGTPILSRLATSSVMIVPKPETAEEGAEVLSSSSTNGGDEETVVDCGDECADSTPLISGSSDGTGDDRMFAGGSKWNLAAIGSLPLNSYLWLSFFLSALFVAYLFRRREGWV